MDIVHSVPFVFYGEVFKAYLVDNRQWYIPIQEVCNALGIDAEGQRQRILRDEAISDRLANLPLETPYRDTIRIQEVACLNLRGLPYWLGTIDVKRVKEEHRKKVILFKREFAEAAWAVFRADMIPSEMLAEMGDERVAGLASRRLIAAPLIAEDQVIGALAVYADDLIAEDVPAITEMLHAVRIARIRNIFEVCLVKHH